MTGTGSGIGSNKGLGRVKSVQILGLIGVPNLWNQILDTERLWGWNTGPLMESIGPLIRVDTALYTWRTFRCFRANQFSEFYEDIHGVVWNNFPMHLKP